MKILIISFYYPPDIGPCPLRVKSLVDSLIETSNGELQIDLLTTMPNRYRTFSTKADAFEKYSSVSIRRIAIPAHQSGMTDQAWAFLIFIIGVIKATGGKHWNLVLATSSRLMTATLGAWVSRQCNAMLHLDIRDLFSDTMRDVLKNSPLRHLIFLLSSLESWSFRSADHLSVVSPGFLPYLREVVPQVNPSIYTNGIDDEFLDKDFSTGIQGKPLILYAGNIGEGQCLHKVIPKIALSPGNHVRFRILGDGGKRKELEEQVKVLRLKNVEILKPVSRQELFVHYREARILFLHLNDFKAFDKVLPSKIFEYAATGKPILAGVSGYAAKFLQEEVPGVEVFNPLDIDAMQSGLMRLINGPSVIDRGNFCSLYRRKEIMLKMSKELLMLGTSS